MPAQDLNRAAGREPAGNLSVRATLVLPALLLSLIAATQTAVAAMIPVTKTDDSGPGSLRQAIVDSNASAGVSDTITFKIPGAGVHTITPLSALPDITDAVVIDGYTQPGASANTLAVGDNAVLLIELNGNGLAASAITVASGGSGSTIRGLVINRFNQFIGILLRDGGANTVEGNFIGTDPTGTAVFPIRSGAGVQLLATIQNTIGGTTAAARNLISGCDKGVAMSASDSNTTGNSVRGNYIGTDKSGTVALGNTEDGVVIGSLAPSNSIGGTAAGAGNRIAFNGGRGVNVLNSSGIAIEGNAIFSNGSLGIDLNGDGVTANDPNCDDDNGGNTSQNFPVITSAKRSGSNVTLSGTLDTSCCTTYRLEFFSSAAADPSDSGEGEKFLGSMDVTPPTCISSFGPFAFPITSGQTFVSVTATDVRSGNTSEFSAAVGVPTVQFSSATYNIAENGGSATIMVTRSSGAQGAASVHYSTSNGTATAGSDYTATSGTVTFTGSETSKTFDVPILDDDVFEADETVNLTLSNPQGAGLGDPNTAVLTIVDNEGRPTIHFSSATYTVAEDAGNATITVVRSGATGNAVSADFATSNGTATAGADYTATSGTISFAAGETSKTVKVPIVKDNLFEGDETVNLKLSNPQGGASLSPPASARLTIVDGDSRPTLQFSSANYSVTELGGTATITVTRAGATGNAVAVSYATSDGTATAGQDYTATSGTLQFASGKTSETFNIPILTDTLFEGDETVKLTLSKPQGGAAVGTPGTATLTIMPSTLANISTRERVETGDNVLIGGFIITGNQPKKVMLRAIGPSLPVANGLADPQLELYNEAAKLLESNDNWKDSPDKQAIIDSTIAPTDDRESAILRSLAPGKYTVVIRGVSSTTGVALVEAFDLDRAADSQLSNISTRGFVQTGDDVMIAGFIIVGQDPLRIIVRALGPSLPVKGKLGDPTLDLHDGNGTRLATNNDWKSDQRAEIEATTIPPSNDLESAIVRTLTPGRYTAIVRGVKNTTGVSLVEVFALN
jgi:hypothetical protein